MAEMQEGGGARGGLRMRGFQGSVVDAGTYLVRIEVDGQRMEGTLTVRDDPGIQGVLPSVR